MNVPTSTRGIWLNPAGDTALSLRDLDYLETQTKPINGSRNSVTKLSGTLPKGGGNGLESLNRDLVRNPQQTHIIVAVVDCSQITTDVDTGDEVATARIRRIEPIDPQDKDHAVRILRRAMERRTGDTLLPIETEDELTALLKLLDPDTGELLDSDAGGGDGKDSTAMPWEKDTGDAGSDQ